MTTPIYDPTVPEQLSDSFAISQPELQGNFQALFNAFLVNHISLDSSTNVGNHTFVDLLEQINPILTNLNEIAIYTKDVKGQTDQIFFRYPGQGQEFQFTNYQLYTLPEEVGRTQFFTVLPGSIVVFFGSFTSLENGVLPLFPNIAAYFIGMDMSPMGKDALPGQVSIPARIGGVYQSIITSDSKGSVGACPPSYYIILANT